MRFRRKTGSIVHNYHTFSIQFRLDTVLDVTVKTPLVMHQCKKDVYRDSFSLDKGAKNNLKARCYVTVHTSFDAKLQHGFGIVLM